MEKSVKVSAKYIHKKCILDKIRWRKIAFGAKCNGERRRGFGIIHYKKNAFGVRYNGEKPKRFGIVTCCPPSQQVGGVYESRTI
jgi:hypothetical protein